MDKYHDAFQQIDYIRQSLAQDPNQIGFLIGAGCPLSIRVDDGPLLPDIAGLTQKISSILASPNVEQPSHYDKLSKLFVEDEFADFTIEHALSMIRAMKQVVGHGEVRGFKRSELETLDQEICKVISETMTETLPQSKQRLS